MPAVTASESWVMAEQPPLRLPVGDQPGVRRDEQERQELQAGRDAERGAGVGELENQPVLGDPLHPGAGVADQTAHRVDAEVADREGLERGAHAWERRSRIGAASRRIWRSSAVSSPSRWFSQASLRRRVSSRHGAARVGQLDDDQAPVVGMRARGPPAPCSTSAVTVRVIDGGCTFSSAASSPMVSRRGASA